MKTKEHWAGLDKAQKIIVLVLGIVGLFGVVNSVHNQYQTDDEGLAYRSKIVEDAVASHTALAQELVTVQKTIADNQTAQIERDACEDIQRHQREIDRLERQIDRGVDNPTEESSILRDVARYERQQNSLRPHASTSCE